MNNIDGPSLWRDVEHYKGECRSGSTLEMVPHLKINVISNTSFPVSFVHIHGCFPPPVEIAYSSISSNPEKNRL